MPVRRRYAARRRKFTRKMRRFGRKGGAYRFSKVYKYKRLGKTCVFQNTTVVGTLTQNDATMISLGTPLVDTVGYQFGAAMQFRAANVQTFSDFANLYDQYKITGVKVKIIPLSDSATAQSSGFLPTLYWARDQDDAIIPATEADLRERQDCKTMRLTAPKSIYISYPKAMIDVNQTGGSFSDMVKSGWINCNSTTVQHNGLKMYFKNVDLRVSPTTITAFRVESTYYMKFRNPQ